MMDSILWEKHNYLNKDITCIRNTPIYEYDMSAGGFSILKRAGKLTEEEIYMLTKCSKLERNIYLGNKTGADRALSELQINGFTESRRQLFERNQIADKDIISIKKDAIFTIKKPCSELEFDGFKWKLENSYSSYYYINNIEFYYSGKTNTVDIKGLGKDNIPLHAEGFTKDLCKIFGLAEQMRGDVLVKYLKRYRHKYLNKELPMESYREYNHESMYRLEDKYIAGMAVLIQEPTDIDEVNISYNYMKYIKPLISYYL